MVRGLYVAVIYHSLKICCVILVSHLGIEKVIAQQPGAESTSSGALFSDDRQQAEDTVVPVSEASNGQPPQLLSNDEASEEVPQVLPPAPCQSDNAL